MRIKTIKIIMVLLVLLSMIIMTAGCTNTQNIRSLYEMESIEGNEISISDFSEDIIVVNFWATWCPPCREEIPDFIAAYDKYRDMGVQFVGVSNEGVSTIKDFAEDYGINYPLFVDKGSVIMKEWSIRAIPTTFIFDGNGKIIYKNVGMMTADQLEGTIEDLL